jgi:hypothetical protein
MTLQTIQVESVQAGVLELGGIRAATPFVKAAMIWAAVGAVLCVWLTPTGTSAVAAVLGMFGISLLSLMGFGAMAKCFAAVARLVAGGSGNRQSYVIQAFYWAMIKLACLGLLVTILIYVREIPVVGILVGIATLVVVPLTGGLLWKQTVLKNHLERA